MSWCDEDATMLVRNNILDGNLTTVGADRIRFTAKTNLGERLRFDHEIVHISNTSMTVLSKVYAIRDNHNVLVYEAYTTLASIDENFKIISWSLGHALQKWFPLLEGTEQWKVVEEMRQIRGRNKVKNSIDNAVTDSA